MKVNLGYVAISLKLKDSSPNRTTTFKNLSKLDPSIWKKKLSDLAIMNIENTERIIRYNNAYGIKLYRMTSKIIPLATHDALKGWEWEDELKGSFELLGTTIKKLGIRVSAHPDHFVLLNSPREDVLASSIKDLEYHVKMFKLMGLSNESKLVMHIGGVYGNKKEAIERFYKGFDSLNEDIKERIILENDDKIYTAEDVLSISSNISVPMVLDVHHDRCNKGENNLEDILSSIYDTWKGRDYPPKIHFSSPKSESDFRAHSEYIDKDSFIDFIELSKRVDGRDLDVMIEAKKKDLSLFKLIDDIKKSKNEKISVTSDASFDVK
ncbi:UV DNA damage repair endonuclease UvsE [Clostridium cylindrosporum]|uniref:UV DNA damage endonuclease UvsE n=1 Tax=Clostridium cylindrosporum DSM 605 TaxID=1121307 RepID=A0A0J8D961_CLOCY|nr:UV DNA damage repair endonuclease UvsE [Clostridium cylindrosporum]KMT20818.1 UV DNA damage endonuclease UvsE [Clostridium cylindrosporum DSM 605]